MNYKYIHDKGVGVVNEDTWLASGNLFAVFDGATGIDKYVDEDGLTGGYYASNIAKDKTSLFTGSLKESLMYANKEIASAMDIAGIDLSKKINRWVTSAAIVRFGVSEMEWAQVGDCLILLINKDGTNRLLVDGYDHDSETLTKRKELVSSGSRDVHSELVPLITKKRSEINVSYGALDGESEVIDFIKSGKEDLTGVKEVLLFTDGLFLPKEDILAADDFNHFVDLYNNGGLENIMKYVRDLERSDPGITKYQRFKVHDDIAALSVHVGD